MALATPPTRLYALLAALVTVNACGGGGDHPSGPKPPTPAVVAALTSTTLTAVVGTAISPAPAVRVTSSSGEPVPGIAVSFVITSGGGTVQSASVSTGADGGAAVGGWTLGTAAGQQVLTATVSGLTPVQFTATAHADVAASVTPQGPTTLTGIVGNPVATAPAVLVKDQYGNPVSDVGVTFAVTQGGGSVAGATTTTDAAGVAHPTSWTLGSNVGPNVLTATVAGISTPATFTATAAAGPPASLSFVAGSGQTAAVNTAVAVSPAVRVADSFGNPIAGQTVNFSPLGGSVANATASTGADGVASSGAWTLNKTAGTNSLTAKLGTLSANITAVGVPGPPSALVAVSTPAGTLVVGTDVTPKPSVRVIDAYTNPIVGASVLFTVQSGGGTVAGGNVISDANGLATVGGWTVGTKAGTQALRATLSSVAPLDFVTNAVAGPPALMALVAGAGQYARAGAVLPVSPAVQVLDQYANPVIGTAVSFTPIGVSGVVSRGNATTDPQGVAAIQSWTLGPDEGVDSVYATVAGLPALPIYARVVPVSQFNITLRFLTQATPTEQAAFQRAAERWRDVVIGDLTDVPVTLPANTCGLGEPALNETIDDLLIYVSLAAIDGPGAVLGGGALCAWRTTDGLSLIGMMQFDTADLPQLENNGQLDEVILHEMGHVLGIGTQWPAFGLVSGAGTSDPFYVGASGRAGFSLVGGAQYPGNPVPVENTGGIGTADSHWRESVLNTELMTGYLSPTDIRDPLSLVTIGSLEDLGYAITPWGYDDFILGVDLRRGAQTPGLQIRELPQKLIPLGIDASGKVVPEARRLPRLKSGRTAVDRVRLAPHQLKSVKRR